MGLPWLGKLSFSLSSELSHFGVRVKISTLMIFISGFEEGASYGQEVCITHHLRV